jgi:putative phosphoribosyl transferase
MKFANRASAGMLLADKLDQYLAQHPGIKKEELVIVGLPRGGVPIALEVARKFGHLLDILVAKKLPYPGQPEYAIGAVSSDGIVVLNPEIPQDQTWQAYVEEQRQHLLRDTMRIEQEFYDLSGCKRSSCNGKVVMVIDDGVATGMTAMAALDTLAKRGAARIILAAPVMSTDSYSELRSHCDDVVAVCMPMSFNSVGQHYAQFDQTSNQEVVNALRESLRFTDYPLSQSKDPGVKYFGI